MGVYLVGLGIPESLSITLEAVEALRRCKIVFSSGPGLYIQGFLEQYCADVRRLSPDESAPDQELDFERGCGAALGLAAGGQTIGFVSFGHPMFYDPYSQWLLERCRARRIPCSVVGGISSFDAIFASLGVSLTCGTGLQAGDLDYFRDRLPDPRCFALLFHSHVDPEAVRRLFRRCRKSYARSHMAAIIRCRNDGRFGESIRWRSLSSAAKTLGRFDAFTSVLIPPAGWTRPCLSTARSRSRKTALEPRACRQIGQGQRHRDG